MSYQEPFENKVLAISISDSPDMEALGLSKQHLQDAMAEVARHMLALGAQLAYGGDLRSGGFTELLFELVARHRPDLDEGADGTGVVNYVAWPVHISMAFAAIEATRKDLIGVADLICLDLDGSPMSLQTRAQHASRVPTRGEWSRGLKAMRRAMSHASDARVLLGGRVTGYMGTKPGIAEEALISLQEKRPTYLLGGFGGCTRDIAETIGLVPRWAGSRDDWAGRTSFRAFKAADLCNGLTEVENTTLARTPHIDQAIILLMRGLRNIWG